MKLNVKLMKLNVKLMKLNVKLMKLNEKINDELMKVIRPQKIAVLLQVFTQPFDTFEKERCTV